MQSLQSWEVVLDRSGTDPAARVLPSLGVALTHNRPRGVKIASVAPDTPAAATKVSVGDVIVAVNGDRVTDKSYFEVTTAIATAGSAGDAVVRLELASAADAKAWIRANPGPGDAASSGTDSDSDSGSDSDASEDSPRPRVALSSGSDTDSDSDSGSDAEDPAPRPPPTAAQPTAAVAPTEAAAAVAAEPEQPVVAVAKAKSKSPKEKKSKLKSKGKGKKKKTRVVVDIDELHPASPPGSPTPPGGSSPAAASAVPITPPPATATVTVAAALAFAPGEESESDVSAPTSPAPAAAVTAATGKVGVVSTDADGDQVVLSRCVKLYRPVGPGGLGMKIVASKVSTYGARISELVPGGPAAQAGCAVDDIITAINGKPMLNSTINQVGLDIKHAGGSLTMDLVPARCFESGEVQVVAKIAGSPPSLRKTLSGSLFGTGRSSTSTSTPAAPPAATAAPAALSLGKSGGGMWSSGIRLAWKAFTQEVKETTQMYSLKTGEAPAGPSPPVPAVVAPGSGSDSSSPVPSGSALYSQIGADPTAPDAAAPARKASIRELAKASLGLTKKAVADNVENAHILTSTVKTEVAAARGVKSGPALEGEWQAATMAPIMATVARVPISPTSPETAPPAAVEPDVRASF